MEEMKTIQEQEQNKIEVDVFQDDLSAISGSEELAARPVYARACDNAIMHSTALQDHAPAPFSPSKTLATEQTNTVVIGKKGSAKTTWAWAFAKKIADESGRGIFTLNHPRPELFKDLPFKVTNLTRMDAMFNVTDGVVIIDEAHETFNVLDKRVNEDLKILLSRSRQNNTCFIFICHNSYFVNRGLFSFVDVRVIKEVNEKHWELERSHMKKLYQDTHVFGKENFYIDSDEVKGYFNFTKPDWCVEELCNAYRAQKVKEDFFKT